MGKGARYPTSGNNQSHTFLLSLEGLLFLPAMDDSITEVR